MCIARAREDGRPVPVPGSDNQASAELALTTQCALRTVCSARGPKLKRTALVVWTKNVDKKRGQKRP
jgi:hypothetical protein